MTNQHDTPSMKAAVDNPSMKRVLDISLNWIELLIEGTDDLFDQIGAPENRDAEGYYLNAAAAWVKKQRDVLASTPDDTAERLARELERNEALAEEIQHLRDDGEILLAALKKFYAVQDAALQTGQMSGALISECMRDARAAIIRIEQP
jgi:biotin operon repressor